MSTEQSATDRQHLDLAALNALADAATPGPWRAEPGAVNLPGDKNPWPSDYVAPIDSNGSLRGSRFKVPTEADAKFIAAARVALPILVAELERLRPVAGAAKTFRRAIESSLGMAVATGAIDALVDAVDALTEPEEPTDV